MYDTGALISLMDSSRDQHERMQIIHESLASESVILLSPIALSEYGVRGDVKAVIKRSEFTIPSYNERHAIEAAKLKAHTMKAKGMRDKDNKRDVIINDTQIIAQAHAEKVNYIITEDINTFYKTADSLKKAGLISLEALPVSDCKIDSLFLQPRQLPLL